MNTLIRENLPTSLDSICADSIDSSLRWIEFRFGQLLGLMRGYLAVAKQRQALSQLTDDQLKDIGITRVDAMQEANKPFWE